MINEEIWKPITGYEDLYWISNKGNMRHRKGMFKLKPNHKGYCRVTLYNKDSIARTASVHSLVLEMFVGARPEGKIIRHLDGNSTNNTVENLRYGTYLENEQDKRRHGRVTIGERHSQCKLTIDKVLEIKRIHKKSCQKHGAAALAKIYGVSPWQVRNIISGGGWTEAIAQAALKNEG